ncbi:hypothetical protein [Pseudoclavibacter sp. CFCC 13611]|uniref:hypothetical protein n=1 Tax=Pseudoclavibacter sp. CFCC 13611 TaxID=2615178 RepID=UPI001300EC8B|nr:hypothetical protein [Pseudoclavibacter sp. CFCC 13611]KAB1663361.1 hypothetical protein F8O08_06305 [Pseudoclavibacter sp. CFCC 13611]
MVTVTSLAKDERAARVALAAVLEPDDSMTGRILTAGGAVETIRLAASSKVVDPVEGELWRKMIAPRLDVVTLERVLTRTDRFGLTVLVPGDRDWPAALNGLGDCAPTAL